MTDVELSLLMLAMTGKLPRSVREETTRQLLDPATSQLVVEALTSGKAEGLAGWQDQPEASRELAGGEPEQRAWEAVRRSSRLGAQLMFRGTAAYPQPLLDLDVAPPVLYMRGDPAALAAGPGLVAMVGTRTPSTMGKAFARRSARELAGAGFRLVSGLALGTDAEVHAGALDAAGRTIAVLPAGVDAFTPRSNRDLGRRILDTGGAVLSERPPGSTVQKWYFPYRNRIIAALASNVVILEAGIGSGTTITGEAALQLERQLWVMPGRPGDARTAGGLHLLDYDGVKVFHGSQSLLERQPGSGAVVLHPAIDPELLDLAHQIAVHLPCRLDQLVHLLGVADRLPVLLGSINLLKLHAVLHEDATGQLALVGPLPPRQPVR